MIFAEYFELEDFVEFVAILLCNHTFHYVISLFYELWCLANMWYVEPNSTTMYEIKLIQRLIHCNMVKIDNKITIFCYCKSKILVI